MVPTKTEQFFLQAVHGTSDYDTALVLTGLVSLGAGEAPVRSTLTGLIASMGGTLTRSQAWRASNRLASQGVLHVRVYPRAWTEYHLDHVRLSDVLSRGAARLGVLTRAITNTHPFAAPLGKTEDWTDIREFTSPDQPLEESR